jgi:hypothetical protein
MTIATALLAVYASFAPLQQDSVPLPDTIVQLPEFVVSGTRSVPVPRMEQAASLTLTVPKAEQIRSAAIAADLSSATRCCTWWTESP